MPILDKMLDEQEVSKRKGEEEIHWTPSKVIRRLGKEINDERSVYYWCYKNDIPVFCPALTDGSLGDMLYFHTFKSSPAQLRIDIVEDIRKINTIAVRAKRAGMIILGGGIVKHRITPFAFLMLPTSMENLLMLTIHSRHCERMPDAQWCRERSVHQHSPGV